MIKDNDKTVKVIKKYLMSYCYCYGKIDSGKLSYFQEGIVQQFD